VTAELVPHPDLTIRWSSDPHTVDQLAVQLDAVRLAVRDLKVAESELVTMIADRVGVGATIPDPSGDGGWRVKRKAGRKVWDHDAIHRVLLARGRDARRMDRDTGEVLESEGEAVARVLMECAGIGYWRVTNLARYGVDADEYRATDPGAVTVEREDPPDDGASLAS
jgi:hypothetical protein